MRDPFKGLPEDARRRLKRRRQPAWVQPMLATLTEKRFSDPDWIFERKVDGERCLAFRRGGEVRLLSRNRQVLNGNYPEIVSALERQKSGHFIVDGEIVAFAHGVTSFARLQRRMQVRDPEQARRTGVAVYFYVFDLLYLDGFDTSALPLRQRKALLRKVLWYGGPLRYMAHVNERGTEAYRAACRQGLEGVTAKRATGRYVQRRSTDWLKFKCSHGQEFVVGGFTEPKGSRIGLGALLIGYYRRNRLMYAGKVGTGYTRETLRTLRRSLGRIERDDPLFSGSRIPERSVHWVTPRMVVEVAFTEWTRDGQLRHPRFLGVRRDKKPRAVVRES